MQDLVPLWLYSLVTNHPPPPVDRLIERVVSPHARRTYEQIALYYLSYIERDPFSVDAHTISTFKAEMLVSYRPEAVALRLRIVRELYDESIAMGLLAANPALSVSFPPIRATPLHTPTPDTAASYMESCDRRHEAGRRDRALCLLALENDSILEQVPALTVRDFQHKGSGGVLHSRAPESAAHSEVGLSVDASLAVEDYLAKREVADDSPLFGLPRLHVHRRRNDMTAHRRGARGPYRSRCLARVTPWPGTCEQQGRRKDCCSRNRKASALRSAAR